MDKKRLLQAIIRQLRERAETLLEAAKTTRDEATHGDNKAESKYDTRGLEASYLAEGQARKAEEAEANLARYVALSATDPPDGEADAIEVGALVEVAMGKFRDFYFCGPGAGGMEVEMDGQECTIVTRDSPMGRCLFGAHPGSSFELNGRTAKIVAVR